jgi:toxin ParE1/3/4
MALPIVLSSSALEDLDAISFGIANDSPAAAIRWLESIDETMQLIASHPGLGERVPHLGQAVRRITLGKYLLFFRPLADRVELVRVIHGARRIEHLEP